MLFNRMPERYEIILNRAGASMLGGRVRIKKFRAGNFSQATRVPHDNAHSQPPAMVAAMMRPGPPSSMNVNDFHNSLGHANVKALYETAKQMGIKLTGIQEYCDGCAAAKAIKRTVPKVVDSSRKPSRPFQRIFMDLAGGYPKSTGGAKYLMQPLDDYTNFGWTVFLGDKSGPTVVRAFRTWYASVKQLSVSTIGGGGDTTIPFPGNSRKQPLPGIGLHDPLHGRQACPEFNSFHQGVGQISPLEGLFECRLLPKRGKNCDIPAPPTR